MEKLTPEEKKALRAQEKEARTPLHSIFDLASILAMAVIAVAFAFTFVFRTVEVVGNSMYPTLHNGDRIILSAVNFKPEYGQIVVPCQPSKNPAVPDTLVKRVIATAGQTVDIDFTQGVVYVNGQALEEAYINEPTHERENFNGPLTVPEGYVFVMGDNRNASTDSRSNSVGLIREEYIMGKALFRIVPFGYFALERY